VDIYITVNAQWSIHNKTDAENVNPQEFCRFLRNLLQVSKRFAVMMTGSFFELPIQYATTNATDWDFMYIPTDICALPYNMSTPSNFRGTMFTIGTNPRYPGFARLYAIDGKLQTNISLKNKTHGPAHTHLVNSREKFMAGIRILFCHHRSSKFNEIPIRWSDLKTDRVFAVYCPCWPTVADEWKTRERPSGWPPKELIARVVSSGCHFVAKPHQSNPNDHTQWRFSFSKAEIILIHTWTDVQKYIYHILRLIKSEVVKACGGSDETIICTYFFKTLMFWECERQSKEFWDDENVEKSVSELLCIMIGWLIDGCCTNYFIPKNNMIPGLTKAVVFNKEIELLLTYATYGIKELTSLWPKAYPRYFCRFRVAIPQKLIFNGLLELLRGNVVNPLNPFIKTKLLKLLTNNNSLLCFKVFELYRGIVTQLKAGTEKCFKRKDALKLEALNYFLQSLKESGNECTLAYFSLGDSIYELSERFNSFVESESAKSCCDSSESNCNGNYEQYSLESFEGLDINAPGDSPGTAKGGMAKKMTEIGKADDLNAYAINVIQNAFGLAAVTTFIATRLMSSAYLANFYYNALQDYKMTSDVCDTISSLFERRRMWACHSERAFPLFLTNDLSAIFDEHFRTVLGLITLRRYIVESLQDSSSVLVRICPVQLIKYLKIQCNRREGMNEPEVDTNFRCSHALNAMYDNYEPLSEVFMLAVLYASCRE